MYRMYIFVYEIYIFKEFYKQYIYIYKRIQKFRKVKEAKKLTYRNILKVLKHIGCLKHENNIQLYRNIYEI